MKKIYVKYSKLDILKELNSIGFDVCAAEKYKNKYEGCTYKLFNIKPYEANILKQLCLSLGFDCAVSRDTVTCKCEYTDCLIFASNFQLRKLIEKLKNQPFRLKEIAELFSPLVNDKNMPVLKLNKHIFDWSEPYIMGIINCTPDSFSDGGRYNTVDTALMKIEQMLNDGADIIDIGGESTRPGAECVSPQEEIQRVIPVIKAVKDRNIDIILSVDTRNYITAKAAIEEGAHIINDVSGLEYDKKLRMYIIENNIPSVIMHSDKIPAISADFTSSDIVENVYLSLAKKIADLENEGMKRVNIIADIGIGFGKSLESNFLLLKSISEFKSLNVPLLLGISRKSFIRNEFNLDFEEADVPTALYSSLFFDVNIHRVHNVKLTKQYLNYVRKLK